MSTDDFQNEFDDEYVNDYVKPTYMSDSDDDDDVQSIATVSTISSHKKSKNLMDKHKQGSPGYVCITPANKKRGEKRIDGYYTSTTTGVPIRNAITGFCENDYSGKRMYTVGSRWEDLFFKVVLTSTKEGSLTLFYDSPEQYAQHMRTKVQDSVAMNWYAKHQRAVNDLNEFQESRSRPQAIDIR